MVDKILLQRPNIYETLNHLPHKLFYLTTGLYLLFNPEFRLRLKHERVVNQFSDLEKSIPNWDVSSNNVLQNQLVGKIFHHFPSGAFLGLFHNAKEGSIHVLYGKPGQETDIRKLIENMRVIGETLSCVDYSQRRPFPLTTYPNSLVTVSVGPELNNSHLGFSTLAFGNPKSFPKDIPSLIDQQDQSAYFHFPHRSNCFSIPINPDYLRLKKHSFMEEEIDRATSLMQYISNTAHMAFAGAIRETMDLRRSDDRLL